MMKRFIGALVVACALATALAASPALAGLPLGGGGSQDQTVTSSTGQENEAGALNVPVLSGNNVSVLSGGSQSSSTGISQSQENENTTKQHVSQRGSDSKCPPRPCDRQEQTVSNRTKQENEAFALNAPIASGNNVAVLSKVCQTSSTGVWQKQENENATWQRARQAA